MTDVQQVGALIVILHALMAWFVGWKLSSFENRFTEKMNRMFLPREVAAEKFRGVHRRLNDQSRATAAAARTRQHPVAVDEEDEDEVEEDGEG